ncbi:Hypothetical_protein [Hexamita inflata]|uniref:Hypothetical_protein n=1 Tax=Hexamita inflata TaxID=28002 RepID=A0AA86NFH8_9EUKA|nr:Hypothetical protein HINF_LOCUS6235 [Hexamita inflata]CAI9943741.1 Hypothetical protein HINF_LOCUS31386 [Hexamita inflata]CAI9944973.1 Hypothetical protein HINF_LOCUS32618 [Hexamita inflata]
MERREHQIFYYTFIKRINIETEKLAQSNIRWFFGSQTIQAFKSTDENHNILIEYLKSINAEITDDTSFCKMFTAGDFPTINTERGAILEQFKCSYVHYINQKQKDTTLVFLLSEDLEQHKNVMKVWRQVAGDNPRQEHTERPERQERGERGEYQRRPQVEDTNEARQQRNNQFKERQHQETKNLFAGIRK